MKKQSLIMSLATALVVSMSACDSASSKIKGTDSEGNLSTSVVTTNDDQPQFSFETLNHDFGTITEGDPAIYEFKFTNTGKAPLVITKATGSCGCTVPEYPREPIAAGGEGVIKVSFDSNNRTGRQEKTVTLVANTVPNTTILKITADVMAKN